MLDRLFGSKRLARSQDGDLLARLRARSDSRVAGLAPDPADPEALERERSLGQRFAVELHASTRTAPPLGRRAAAAADAARHRRAEDLAEALHGLGLADAPALLDALAARSDVPGRRLAEAARAAAERAAAPEPLGLALSLLAFSDEPGDLPLLVMAGRCEALSGVCAEALARRGEGAALLALARGAVGIGRAVALERLALPVSGARPPGAAEVDEALILAGAIEDPVTRAYAAVALLESAGVAARAASASPELLESIASGVEACARGGWNGGPGPGLGRLAGAQAAAQAVLSRVDAPADARRRAALGLLTASPVPAAALRKQAEEVLRSLATPAPSQESKI